MANEDLKSKALNAKVKMWEIAEAYGIADTTLSKRLRHELPDEEKAKIFKIIDELKRG